MLPREEEVDLFVIDPVVLEVFGVMAEPDTGLFWNVSDVYERGR